MIEKTIQLRAHHGMCLAFFEGKGYSDAFAAHMGMILEKMADNPKIKVMAAADVICRKCPNLCNGTCNASELVQTYDSQVLALCGLEENTLVDWNTFSRLIEEKVIEPKKREEICGNCEWNDICRKREMERIVR